MTSIEETLCTSGNSDIVGPGVRISIYIQGLLAFIKVLLADGDEVVETTKFGSFMALGLIISALTFEDLSYVLRLQISQFALVLLVSYFSVPILVMKVPHSK